MFEPDAPDLRLEISGCEELGSRNMIMRLYNDKELIRRAWQPTVLLLLKVLLENDDIVTLVFLSMTEAYRREQCGLFNLSVYLATVRKVSTSPDMFPGDDDNVYLESNRSEQANDFLITFMALFCRLGEHIVTEEIYDTKELFGRPLTDYKAFQVQKGQIISLLSAALCAMLLCRERLSITIYSHSKHKLFSTCFKILDKHQQEYIAKTMLDTSLWLPRGRSLKVISCGYCKKIAQPVAIENHSVGGCTLQ